MQRQRFLTLNFFHIHSLPSFSRQRTPVCPSTRVAAAAEVVAVAATRATSPASPTIPSHSGIPISPASMVVVYAIVHDLVPVRMSTTHSIIPSMSTPAQVAPMRAAFIAMARPGHTTCPCGPQSGHRMSRASSRDSPAGSPATACPPMAQTTEDGVTIRRVARAWSEATQCT